MVLSRLVDRRGVAGLLLGAVAASACGGTSAGTPSEATIVVATTSIWADITSSVLCGEPVVAVIPPGADPHTFEPSLRDRELIERADLIVTNGADLEGGLLEMVGSARADDALLIEITPHVDVLPTDHDDDADHDDTATDDHDDDADHDEAVEIDEHGHGLDADPHVWQDPARIAGALDVIGSAARATGRPDCSDDLEAELRALDDEITELLADIPPSRRVMVTSHDSLAYFADRYDLEVVGTVIPSTNTLAEANAADLAALAETIDEHGVRVIFTEELESTTDADALAERLDVTVVPLVTDALTSDPTSDSYAEMMRSNATLIAEALAP